MFNGATKRMVGPMLLLSVWPINIYDLFTLNEPKSKGGGYWLQKPYPNDCFK